MNNVLPLLRLYWETTSIFMNVLGPEGYIVFPGRRKEMFYLTTHSTHFIYGYMVSNIWLKTILIVRMETLCRHIHFSFWLTARFILYAPSHRQDCTYHGLCYTGRGALIGTRNSSWIHPWRIDPTTRFRDELPVQYIYIYISVRDGLHYDYLLH